MISLNDRQKTKIENLKPLSDSMFQYDKTRWSGLNADYKNVIQDFEDKKISRLDVINAYKDYYTDNNIGIMRAFLLTMIWGFSNTGYGTYRTNLYISNEENRTKIKTAIDYLNQNNPDSLKNAYRELTKIKGLGVSYLTKVLYFATRAKNIDNYALIFDIRVAVALIKLTTPKEIHEILTIGPSSKFKDYQNFNTLMHMLAKKNDVEAEQLEMYLFTQDFE